VGSKTGSAECSQAARANGAPAVGGYSKKQRAEGDSNGVTEDELLITAPDEIRTARLLLRKPRTTEAPLMLTAYAQDPAVTRYLTWRPHANVAETGAVIDRFLAAWERQEGFCWFLFTNDTGEMIGSIAARSEKNGFNLGFLLARAYWGHGYMPEAIAAVVDWAFTQPSVSRVSAACHASARALEKAGFVRGGILHQFCLHPNISSALRDCFEYAITRSP
jgi:ribosomal-protein-alanine N-acetyltransferase